MMMKGREKVKPGCADGVRRFPNIWQKAINKGVTILKIHKCRILVSKAMSEILNYCFTALSFDSSAICIKSIRGTLRMLN